MLLETESKLIEIEKGTVNLSEVNKGDYLLELLVSQGKHVLTITKLFEDYEKMMDEDDPDDNVESFEICYGLIWEAKNFIVTQFSKLVDEFGDIAREKLGDVDTSDNNTWDLYLTKMLELYVKTHSK